MRLQTKKLIAREFLILTIVLSLGFICFLSTYPYNYFKNRETNILNKSIELKNKQSDSLSNLFKTKSQKRNNFFEKFKIKFGSDTYQSDEFWKRLDYLAKKDSIKYKWNYVWDKKLIAFNKELDFNTPEKFKDFLDSNSINDNDLFNNNKSLKLQFEINSLLSEKNVIESKRLSFSEQVEFGIKSFVVFCILFFAVRYLVYAVKWSLKVLKQ